MKCSIMLAAPLTMLRKNLRYCVKVLSNSHETTERIPNLLMERTNVLLLALELACKDKCDTDHQSHNERLGLGGFTITLLGGFVLSRDHLES